MPAACRCFACRGCKACGDAGGPMHEHCQQERASLSGHPVQASLQGRQGCRPYLWSPDLLRPTHDTANAPGAGQTRRRACCGTPSVVPDLQSPEVEQGAGGSPRGGARLLRCEHAERGADLHVHGADLGDHRQHARPLPGAHLRGPAPRGAHAEARAAGRLGAPGGLQRA